VKSASLSFICFRVLSVSRIPGTRVVEFALSSSYFSRSASTVCLIFVNSLGFLPLFFMESWTLFSISKTLSFREKSERG